jgi:hypothetical protein
MKLQIWHNSNLGNPHFVRSVPDIETAKEWLKLLADYDLYQGDRVAANAQGLMVWNEKSMEWDEWEREEDGESITTVIDEETAQERGWKRDIQEKIKRRVTSTPLRQRGFGRQRK